MPMKYSMENEDKKHPLDALQLMHTREAIRVRLKLGPRHSYLRDFIYGAIDGTVTTFAVVSAVEGANLPVGVIIILGLANLFGDGFSMAIGNYLGTRAEDQLRIKAREMEEYHIATVPDGEREEIRQIFSSKGFKGEDLERAVKIITSDMKTWVDTMLQEELGLPIEGPSPIRAAFSTFAAFILVGLIPLLAYIFQSIVPGGLSNPFLWSIIMTAFGFFVVGALKSRYVGQSWILAGMETLIMGGSAAGLAYLVGLLLRDIVKIF